MGMRKREATTAQMSRAWNQCQSSKEEVKEKKEKEMVEIVVLVVEEGGKKEVRCALLHRLPLVGAMRSCPGTKRRGFRLSTYYNRPESFMRSSGKGKS